MKLASAAALSIPLLLSIFPAGSALPVSFPTSPHLQSRANVSPEDRITFLNSIASATNSTATLNLSIHAYATRPIPIPKIDPLVTTLSALAGITPGASTKFLDERLSQLFVVGIPNKNIELDIAGAKFPLPSATSITGEVDTKFDIPQSPPSTIDYKASLQASDTRQITGKAFVLQQTGVSVISDIDDTIKVSEVNSITKLLQHTFLLPFTPVTGMSELYNNLNTALTQSNQQPSFHYLSNSPWNLYTPLEKFTTESNFPPGQFLLRDFSVLDGSVIDFIKTNSPHKVDSLAAHVAAFPQRKLIMIGDSTERDPESYAEIARRFPGNVGCIAIRVVSGVDAAEETTENANERFVKAFEGVDGPKWITFSQPGEIDVGKLVGGGCR